MKAGMFLAGLGSGVAQGYMIDKTMKNAKRGNAETMAPVRDAVPIPVGGAETAKPVTPDVPTSPDPAPTADVVTNPAKKRANNTGVTAVDVSNELTEYMDESKRLMEE